MIITLFPLPSQLFPSDIRPLPDLWVEVPGANFEKHLEDGNPHCPARPEGCSRPPRPRLAVHMKKLKMKMLPTFFAMLAVDSASTLFGLKVVKLVHDQDIDSFPQQSGSNQCQCVSFLIYASSCIYSIVNLVFFA